MAKIIGNTTATPTPRSDWTQTDATKADYIKNKPDLDALIAEYSIEKSDESGDDFAAVYRLTKDGAAVGDPINIPKDMLVESGAVVINPEGQEAGTYIELFLQNVEDPLYINVGDLVDNTVSGSQAGDMVVVNIEDNTVTATITDGTINKEKFTNSVQRSLDLADSAVQQETDPTVPSWAKAVNKPSYNLDELSDTSNYIRMTPAERSKLQNIAAGANKYEHPEYTVIGNGLYKIQVDIHGHVNSVVEVEKSDIVNLGIPSQDTTYLLETTGEGNAITEITQSGELFTATKGDTFVPVSMVGAKEGVAALDENGLVVSSQLPPQASIELGDIFPVTTEDNGKIMQVVEGAWSAANLSDILDIEGVAESWTFELDDGTTVIKKILAR